MKEKIYVAPQVEEIEITVEQPILTDSGQPSDYPGWGGENPLF